MGCPFGGAEGGCVASWRPRGQHKRQGLRIAPVVVVVGFVVVVVALVVGVDGAVVVVVAGASAVGADGPTMYGPPMPVPDGRRCVPGSMPVRAAFEILSAMTLIGAGSENSVTGTSFSA